MLPDGSSDGLRETTEVMEGTKVGATLGDELMDIEGIIDDFATVEGNVEVCIVVGFDEGDLEGSCSA